MKPSAQKLKSSALAASSSRKGNKSAKKGVKAFPPHLRLLVDPWNSPTAGAGRPDFNPDPVVVWPESFSINALTNAQGDFAVWIRPKFTNFYQTLTLNSDADPAITATVDATPAIFTTLSSTFSSWRPMVLGVEVSYVGEAQLQKGIIAVNPLPAGPAIGDRFSVLSDEQFYTETPSHENAAVRLCYVDSAFGSAGETAIQKGVMISGSGLPASLSCIRIRVRVVFECSVSHSQLLSRDATHTISHPAQLATAASLVGKQALVATGPDPVAKLIAHGEKLALVAGAVNGLWQAAKPLAGLMTEFAALI